MAAPLTMQQLGWFEYELYRLQRTSSAVPASVTTTTASYTVTDDDWYVFVNPSVTRDITLPRPEARTGHEYTIKKIGTSAAEVRVKITGGLALLEDGSSVFILRSPGESAVFVSDGTQWRVVHRVLPPNPETRVVVYDDFMSLNGNTAGTDVVSSHSWRTAGATPGVAAINGHVRVDGNGATQGRFELTRAGAFNLVTSFGNAVDYRTRVAQLGSSAGTRRFGLSASALTADVDGMYFRHTAGGNYTCVVRNSGSEDTEDSGVAAAADTFHTFRILSDGSDAVYFFVDGTRVATFGAVTHDVPTASSLGISYAAGGTGANTGLTLDYAYLEHTRNA